MREGHRLRSKAARVPSLNSLGAITPKINVCVCVRVIFFIIAFFLSISQSSVKFLVFEKRLQWHSECTKRGLQLVWGEPQVMKIKVLDYFKVD